MKNIVVCCDGTGNEYNAQGNTNVVKLFQLLKKDDQTKQISFYDPGIGTFSAPGVQSPLFKFITRLLGLAFGYGFSHNLMEAYLFLQNNYEPGDRVYLFGFSRGAYTVRALAGMLNMLGLLEKGSSNLIPYALKIYTQRKRVKPKWATGKLAWISYFGYFFWKQEPDWRRAHGFKETFSRECTIHFIGVWDTVKSIGWFRRRIVLPYTFNNTSIQGGCHAVSIDEKRSQYRSNLWGYINSDQFKEVWFAGVHSDVGGSYLESDLSDIALEWMLNQAVAQKLEIEDSRKPEINSNPLGVMHNTLFPIWWLLGWSQRKIKKCDTGGKSFTAAAPAGNTTPQPWIHKSVKTRIEKLPGNKKYNPPIPPNAVYVD